MNSVLIYEKSKSSIRLRQILIELITSSIFKLSMITCDFEIPNDRRGHVGILLLSLLLLHN